MSCSVPTWRHQLTVGQAKRHAVTKMDVLILYGGLLLVGVSLTLCTRCMRKLEVKKEEEEPATKSVKFQLDGADGETGEGSGPVTPPGRIGETVDEGEAVESRTRIRRSPRSGFLSPDKHD